MDKMSFKFNTIGLFNTARKPWVYKVIAKCGGKEYVYNKVDWPSL